MNDDERERLRTVADYQFGAGAGTALFPDGEAQTVLRTSTGRPQQVLSGDDERLVSYTVEGRFTLGARGGERLFERLGGPHVEVGEESVEFVRDGKNAFAKFVRSVDNEVRPGDEVAVTVDGDVLAVGRAELPADGMRDFDSGVAVKVRAGIEG
ncbi:PUA domain-containing protein [Halomarina oriensis]|uniref:Pseudouridine synthase n=1 Tax=Halomarina oriensis TaxID=671145 RepID=A0A6B0GJW0_9EURY|nr:PUA domain-containing protein [Halomarina oriensis]MWG35206.1 pseudouridine synthase [Halomarina oriensis]